MSWGLTREEAAAKVLWSLGMRGKPHQVRLLLDLLERDEIFTAPELVQSSGVLRGLVYPFIASLRRRGVVFPLPRPDEPKEWSQIYGQLVLNRKRREHHIIRPAPLALNRGRLRTLAAEGCDDLDILSVLEEAEH
ncbi:hypothetical protein MUO93_11925 [Candidatus Bathyarchaeota archaeon]|nr:hypothetical protein [Candidatus Bathyarchaeota archaeon]